MLLSAKEKEEGARGLETVKVQLRSTLVSSCRHRIWNFFFEALMSVQRVIINVYPCVFTG